MTTTVEDLTTLVAFPTVSNRPVTELAAWLATRLEGLGFDVTWFHDEEEAGKANLVARIGPRGTDGLTLSGHMDVVPTEGQPWSSDPFHVVERDGRLYGRGTADMKGFFAGVLQALTRLRGETYQRECVLVWTHDEEVGCLGSRKLVDRLGPDDLPMPTRCLIGEPTDFEVLRMHPGHVAAEIEVIGAAAHSSRPELGRNAIGAMGRIIGVIDAVADELRRAAEPHPEIPRTVVPVNLGTVEGGSAVNIVADRCRLVFGYRPLPGMESEAIFRRVEAHIRDLGLDCDVSARILRDTPSLLTRSDTPLAELLRPHAAPDAGSFATFATDGGNLARIGLEPLVFGAGSIAVAHQADEYIGGADLVRSVDLYEDLIRRCCIN